MAKAKQEYPRFVWARNRNANGRGNDPMPLIIYDDVGVSHLEIVASHLIPSLLIDPSIRALVEIYPAPQVFE